MRFTTGTCVLLLCTALGCTDSATIGGLCSGDCPPADAGRELDACAAAGCASDASMIDAGPICSDEPVELARMQLDLVLVIDDTASVTPWLPALHDGLVEFLDDDAASGVGVGLQRFDEICDAQEYTTLLVPLAPLPGNAAAMETALELMLTASTSTTPALDGSIRFARSWATSHRDATVAVVLLTDASPGACDGLVGDWEAETQRLAREGYEGTPSIKTYAVGFGTMGTVEPIARAGGTEPQLISLTPLETEVRDAMFRIRADALPCAFTWSSGSVPTPNSEVVVSGANATQRHYPILGDSSDCDQGRGFYLQHADAADSLVACPSSCTNITGADRVTLSATCVAP